MMVSPALQAAPGQELSEKAQKSVFQKSTIWQKSEKFIQSYYEDVVYGLLVYKPLDCPVSLK